VFAPVPLKTGLFSEAAKSMISDGYWDVSDAVVSELPAGLVHAEKRKRVIIGQMSFMEFLNRVLCL
jgi:hypothetical protein